MKAMTSLLVRGLFTVSPIQLPPLSARALNYGRFVSCLTTISRTILTNNNSLMKDRMSSSFSV